MAGLGTESGRAPDRCADYRLNRRAPPSLNARWPAGRFTAHADVRISIDLLASRYVQEERPLRAVVAPTTGRQLTPLDAGKAKPLDCRAAPCFAFPDEAMATSQHHQFSSYSLQMRQRVDVSGRSPEFSLCPLAA
jgi:hypothetical protein